MGSDETGPHLRAVEVDEHSFQALLDDLAAEVGHPLAGVGFHLRAGVLHHHLAVAVVHVDQGEGRCGEIVEEAFLAVAVGGEGLVVVQVVVRQVGEDGDLEFQAGDPLLVHGVGTDLHEAVGAALVRHPGEQAVELDGVGGGVGGLQPLAVDVVGDGGDQAAAPAQVGEQVVEQRDGGRLAVGPGDAHQMQFAGRVVEPVVGGQRQGAAAVGYFHQGDAFHRFQAGRVVLVDDGRGAGFDGFADEPVSVGFRAGDGDEQRTGAAGARVEGQFFNLAFQVTAGGHYIDALQYFIESHGYTVL